MAREAGRVRRAERKERKNITAGVAHMLIRHFNNTKITIADAQGNCSSHGVLLVHDGFQRVSRKSTPYAAQVAAEEAAQKSSKSTD